MQTHYKVLGLMSGTSLDGLDLAAVSFSKHKSDWSYSCLQTDTYTYNYHWQTVLPEIHTYGGLALIKFHKQFGSYLGALAKDFLEKNNLHVDYISSHGHTIFHQPENNITFQLGDGANLAGNSEHTTICDFRSLDVSLGGQGAPLVPAGDAMLFNKYACCLNLGGFANISYEYDKRRIAYDICPVNYIINYFARLLGMQYDDKGHLAKQGHIYHPLLNDLNEIPFYKNEPPKSLGREWVEQIMLPLINVYQISKHDILRTLYEHIAIQISEHLPDNPAESTLITGGGCYNDFLISLITKKTKTNIIIPESELIDYKEAIVFAFLGVLRLREESNCLASVTGAKHDNCGGAIYKI